MLMMINYDILCKLGHTHEGGIRAHEISDIHAQPPQNHIYAQYFQQKPM